MGSVIFLKFLKMFSPMQWIGVIAIIITTITLMTVGGNFVTYVQTKLGFDTKESLKEETIVQKGVIKDLKDANATLDTTIDLKDKSSKVDVAVVTDKFKAESRIDSKFEKIKIKKIEDIQVVKDNFKDIPTTIENTAEQTKQISTLQINSLWELYCSETNCSKPTNG